MAWPGLSRNVTRVLITGAAGFLGDRLVSKLLQHGTLGGKAITEMVLADLRIDAPSSPHLKVSVRQGDLAAPAFVAALAAEPFDSIFHLASFLTLQAERDPDTAFAVNVEALRVIIDKVTTRPRVVFASSIAIHGGDLPNEVGDDLNPLPATTYGTHKAINELLIADYSRLGRIDGRCLRLPIVLTRPGTPTPAVSDKVAGILREPLNGIDIAAPLAPQTPVPIVSAGAVIAGLLALHDLPAAELPAKRAFNLPALTVTVAEMADAARRHGATGKITYQPDPQMQQIVDGWPSHFTSHHAQRLGILPDADIDAVITDYLTHRDARLG